MSLKQVKVDTALGNPIVSEVDDETENENEVLRNPLRLTLMRFACDRCGRIDAGGCHGEDGKRAFICRPCAECLDPSFAYASLLYGGATHLILGALALGFSLQASKTAHERVLLHTADLPEEARHLLRTFWRLAEVDYIISAPDLHTAPYDKARFKEVFTKLHIFNPAVLPFDRVVFLDIDTLVVKNLDSLFHLRTPAAICNMKARGGRASSAPKHGERMHARACYFNAGTMLVAPSQLLFDLLVADVQEPDVQWHVGARSPEQKYLSRVLAGQWTALSQVFNFEVQLHSGVPLSSTWENASAGDVFVAHFSGPKKVWDCTPAKEASPICCNLVKQSFAYLASSAQTLAATRSAALHSQWHRALALALGQCYKQGRLDLPIGDVWATALLTGEVGATKSTVLRSRILEQVRWRIGDEVVFQCSDDEFFLATVIRIRAGATIRRNESSDTCAWATIWMTPSPAQDSLPVGPFGTCRDVPVDKIRDLSSIEKHDLALGTEVIAWLGEGHARGLVTGVRLQDEERLIRFVSRKPPEWYPVDELRSGTLGDCFVDPLQCAGCLRRSSKGQFKISESVWYCCDCY